MPLALLSITLSLRAPRDPSVSVSLPVSVPAVVSVLDPAYEPLVRFEWGKVALVGRDGRDAFLNIEGSLTDYCWLGLETTHDVIPCAH